MIQTSNRPSYDTDTYKYSVRESENVGKYRMSGIFASNDSSCYVPDPSVKLGRYRDCYSVDTDSILSGRADPYSKCPTKEVRHVPTDIRVCPTKQCAFSPTEATRTSNPPCTQKEIGINRWVWLMEDPQDKALMRFETNVCNRLIVKDNHRPILIDNTDSNYKELNASPSSPEQYTWNGPALLPFVHWRPENEMLH